GVVVTEAEFNICTQPDGMLWFLRGRCSVRDRRLRLFACVCCRRLGDLLFNTHCRRAVETAERYVDGLATLQQLRTASGLARRIQGTWLREARAARDPHTAALHTADPAYTYAHAANAAAFAADAQPLESARSAVYALASASTQGDP